MFAKTTGMLAPSPETYEYGEMYGTLSRAPLTKFLLMAPLPIEFGSKLSE